MGELNQNWNNVLYCFHNSGRNSLFTARSVGDSIALCEEGNQTLGVYDLITQEANLLAEELWSKFLCHEKPVRLQFTKNGSGDVTNLCEISVSKTAPPDFEGFWLPSITMTLYSRDSRDSGKFVAITQETKLIGDNSADEVPDELKTLLVNWLSVYVSLLGLVNSVELVGVTYGHNLAAKVSRLRLFADSLRSRGHRSFLRIVVDYLERTCFKVSSVKELKTVDFTTSVYDLELSSSF